MMKTFLINLGYHFNINYKSASIFIIKIIDFHSIILFDTVLDWIRNNSIKIDPINLENYLNDLDKEFYYGN